MKRRVGRPRVKISEKHGLVSITMAPQYKQRLDDLAKATGMSKSQIVLNALHFFDEVKP